MNTDSRVDASAVVDGVAATVADGVGRLTIDRRDRMNALDSAASRRIIDVLTEWNERADVRVVVLDGAGGNFSTGADVAGIGTMAAAQPAGLSAEQSRAIISNGTDLTEAVRTVQVPVVAAVDGAAVGIGASLAVAADLIYLTERSYFLLAFVNIGLMPDGGASMLFAASLGRARANELALLGEKLGASEAFAAGLVNRVVADRPELDAEVARVTARLAAVSPAALRRTKAALDDHTLTGLPAALQRELDGQAELLQSPQFQQALRAFAARSKH